MAEAEHPWKIQKRVCEDRISALPDDVLIHILLCVPTKDAVATTFLSKRWRFVWTKLPHLIYTETEKSKSVWWLLEQSMRLYNAPILKSLCIELSPQCPVDIDVVNWLAKAVDHRIRQLFFDLQWTSEPTRMPNSLYSCKTLVILTLSNKILVDVPPLVSLPLLVKLHLLSVVYRDEDSHVRLFSGCPILRRLKVRRRNVDDNVRHFTVKVPSLLSLIYFKYSQEDEEVTDGSLVIDTPALVHLVVHDIFVQSCSIEYLPRLAIASFDFNFDFHPSDNFRRTLSSIKVMWVAPNSTMDPFYSTVNYPKLNECLIYLYDKNLCKSLVGLLSNCPRLKTFMVDNSYHNDEDDDLVLWNQPSFVPKCVSSHIEIFEWNEYEGREDEKEFIRYILQNSKRLKTVGISLKSTLDGEEKEKMIKELESMHRASKSTLLFSTQMMSTVCGAVQVSILETITDTR